MNDPVEVVAVHRQRGEGLLDSGEVFPIVQWLDADGDEIDGPDDAIAAVGRLPRDQGFVVIDLRRFEGATFH